jgi:hypothetical protein
MMFLLACAPENASFDTFLGMVTAEIDEGDGLRSVDAELQAVGAYGYSSDGKAVFYLSAKAAGCDTVAAYLSGDGDQSAVMEEHSCEFMVTVYKDYNSAGTSIVDDKLAAGVFINCAMDTGSWEANSYTGPWWAGYPESAFSLGMVGGEGQDFELSIDMSGFSGSWSHSGSLTEAPATGTLKGTVLVEWCEAMSESSLFPG